MFPVGGVAVMLLGIAMAGVACAGLALALQRRLGQFAAVNLALFVWSVLAIGVLTLIPAAGAPGIVPVEDRLPSCSWDIGGPAPDGFWIFSGGQRLLNTVIFLPSGALLVLLAARRIRSAWVTVPIGLAGLAAYAVVIEWLQLTLARLDRACDVTDIIDNVTGAVLGVLIGVVLSVVLRPWQHQRQPAQVPVRKSR